MDGQMSPMAMPCFFFCAVCVLAAAAIAYTLIETAKLSGVNPQAWLTDTLARIADHKITKLEQLVPWRYAQH